MIKKMQTMKIRNIITLVAIATTFSACDDLFEPALENNRTEDQIFSDPTYAQGVLGYAYAMLPYETKSTTDIATDDAVTNDLESAYRQMALGSWNANNDPVSQWQARKATIQYLNLFLANLEGVKWAKEPYIQTMYCDHLRGEALALRALNMYYLMRNHGGRTADNKLLGEPNLTVAENAESDINLQRNKIQECVAQMFDDLDNAIELLPTDYVNLTKDTDVPAKYQAIGVKLAGDYNRVFGTYMRGRMSGRIAEALKAQIALLASSPAFVEGTEVTSAQAAEYAADVLNRIGGVNGMDPKGHTWFMDKATIDALGSGEVPAEILWRGNKNNVVEDWAFGLNQESENYVPTLYGKGRINPTQNLVDAFPMANGYPISDVQSGYSMTDPYANRDPRLSEYILYNGSTYKNTEIITGSYSTDDNGLNKTATSTRTGYYLRKLMRDDCNPNPASPNGQYHYPVYIRYTEIFLAYAEAANEAFGPTGKATNASYSAYDVIKAIRARAGVGADNGDAYLESIKGDQNAMRELIRNERRIELCFENKRFWDMRRWNLSLTEGAKGMDVQMKDGVLEYVTIEVENRSYKEYMNYGPIPYGEVLKWSNLQQNKGW